MMILLTDLRALLLFLGRRGVEYFVLVSKTNVIDKCKTEMCVLINLQLTAVYILYTICYI